MDIKCKLEKYTSKDGKVFWTLFIPDLDKRVFLNNQELKIFKLLYKIGE